MARRRTAFTKKTAYYTWVGVQASSGGFSTTNTLFGFVASGVAATIRRTRGMLVAQIEPGAVSDILMLAFGLAIVSNVSRAAGAASLPSPMDDLSYPWFWHKFVPLIPTSTTQGDNVGPASAARVEIDAKAMRKIRPDEAIVLLGDGIQQSGSPAGAVSVGWRALFDNS